MSFDPKALKGGDVVHVRGEVVAVGLAVIRVKLDSETTVVLYRDQIVHVEPQPLKTDDKCAHMGTGRRGTINAVVGDEAWVHWHATNPEDPLDDHPLPRIIPLSDLKRREG